MKIATTLEEILKQRGEKNKSSGGADSYEDYKHKNGLSDIRGYADAVGALYAASKMNTSTYGANSRRLANKGLQSSGYAAYIDDLAEQGFGQGLDKIKDEYAKREADTARGYASYLDKYRDRQTRLERSVSSHLTNSGVVDMSTAVAYAMSAGLSKEAAERIAAEAYEIGRQKVFKSVLEQTVRLGLDAEGARQLAIKMGISESDAEAMADEVSDMLRYYGNISEEYLDFLEQRANG